MATEQMMYQSWAFWVLIIATPLVFIWAVIMTVMYLCERNKQCIFLSPDNLPFGKYRRTCPLSLVQNVWLFTDEHVRFLSCRWWGQAESPQVFTKGREGIEAVHE